MGNPAGSTHWHSSITPWLLGAEGNHRELIRQLPLVVVTAMLTVIMAVFFPTLLTDRMFLWGLGILAVSLALAAFVPWSRLPPLAVMVLPILDILAIGVARSGAVNQINVLGLLAVFPAIWLATLDKKRGAWIAAAGIAVIVLAPILMSEVLLTAQVWTTLIMLPVTIGAVGFTISIITQRLEASSEENHHQRELLSSILHAIDVGVVALDVKGHTIVCNDQEIASRARIAAAALHGEPSSPATLAALSAMDATPIFASDRKTLIPFARRPIVRAIQGDYFSNYLFWDQADGVPVARYATSGPVRNDAGDVVGCVVAFSDVTPLMKVAAAQAAFAAAASHELRTPLTAILGYTDLLRERLEDDGGPPAPELAVIERGAQRLLVIVQNLLTAATSNMVMTPVRLDLAEATHLAIVSIQPVAEAAGITVEHQTQGSVPARVDPERFGQLLDNLLSNAIKYSPAGGTVTVRTRLDVAANQAVVEIQDQGQGISAADLELVFDHFYRSASAVQSGVPGAGLGLSVVRAIAEQHGGTIALHSKEGQGCTAEVRLPAPAKTSRIAEGSGSTPTQPSASEH